MKLAATIARSLQADMQAELRDIERAVAAGTREAGRGLKTELRRQVASAALGQPADGHLEGRVGPQGIAVVGILVAGRDQQGAEADHLGEPVLDPLGRPRILEAACQARGDAEATLDFGQNQNTAVRGQPSGVKGDVHRLAADG